jgi:hypothetical protein
MKNAIDDVKSDQQELPKQKKTCAQCCCFCCKRPPPIAPSYDTDVESHQWIKIHAAFLTPHNTTGIDPSASKNPRRPLIKKRTTTKKKKNSSYTALQGKYTAVAKTETVRMSAGLSTSIQLTYSGGDLYAQLERKFHPLGSERLQLANITNPKTTYKIKFTDDTGAFDETVSIEYERRSDTKQKEKKMKKNRWFATKIWTDLYINGKKEPGLLVKNGSERGNSGSSSCGGEHPFIQTLSVESNINLSKTKTADGGEDTNEEEDDSVRLTLVVYRGARFERPKKKSLFHSHPSYYVGRIFHLFEGHVHDAEEAALFASRGKLIAILSERRSKIQVIAKEDDDDETVQTEEKEEEKEPRNFGGGLWILKKTMTMDKNDTLRTLARRGIALMLLRRLGLSEMSDV